MCAKTTRFIFIPGTCGRFCLYLLNYGSNRFGVGVGRAWLMLELNGLLESEIIIEEGMEQS